MSLPSPAILITKSTQSALRKYHHLYPRSTLPPICYCPDNQIDGRTRSSTAMYEDQIVDLNATSGSHTLTMCYKRSCCHPYLGTQPVVNVGYYLLQLAVPWLRLGSREAQDE